MNSLDRLFLFVLALVLGILGFGLIASMSGYLSAVLDYFTYLAADAKWQAVSVGVLLLLAAFYLLSMSLRTKGDTGISQETSLGKVKISLRTVESLVMRASSQIKGVRDIVPRVLPSEGGLAIDIEASVSPDLSIPQVSHDLQVKVSEYVESSVGVPVTGVRVHIKALSVDGKARVE